MSTERGNKTLRDQYPVVMSNRDFGQKLVEALGLERVRSLTLELTLGHVMNVTYTTPEYMNRTISYRIIVPLHWQQQILKAVGIEGDRAVMIRLELDATGPVRVYIHKLGDTRLEEVDWSVLHVDQALSRQELPTKWPDRDFEHG